MKNIFNKILFFTMIISFSWVIVGDLVNMHMKLIYKKDLTKHNIYYTKTHKSDKKSYLTNSKDYKKIGKNLNLFFYNYNSFNINIQYIKVFYLTFKNNYSLNKYFSLFLRGPPSSL